MSITICILSYKRPENIKKLIETYNTYDVVSEIIVWNNDPDITIHSKGKTNIVNCSREMGLDARFHAALLAKTDCVMTHDDDLLFPESTIRSLYQSWKDDPQIIHGIMGRDPTVDNTYAIALVGKNVECD